MNFENKRSSEIYLTHCSCVTIILFNADLCKSVFSSCSFRKLVFCLSLNSVFSVSSVLIPRGGSRTPATSKIECFIIIVNFQPLTIITKRFILDVAAVLDPPLNPMSSL